MSIQIVQNKLAKPQDPLPFMEIPGVEHDGKSIRKFKTENFVGFYHLMFFTEENYRWQQYYLLNYRLLWLWRGVGMWYAGQGPGAARHINTDLSHHYHIQHSAPATTAAPHRGDTHFLWSGVQGAGYRPGEDLPSRHTLLMIALPLFVDYYVVGADATNVRFVWVVYYPKSPKEPKNDFRLTMTLIFA